MSVWPTRSEGRRIGLSPFATSGAHATTIVSRGTPRSRWSRDGARCRSKYRRPRNRRSVWLAPMRKSAGFRARDGATRIAEVGASAIATRGSERSRRSGRRRCCAWTLRRWRARSSTALRTSHGDTVSPISVRGDVPPDTVKELFSEVPFHQPDLVADGRRRQLQLGRGLQERTPRPRRDEGLDGPIWSRGPTPGLKRPRRRRDAKPSSRL